MSDRELLELAAKAAGIELHWDEDGPNEVTYYGVTKGWNVWNPLVDDGDALRLAVKLGLTVSTRLTKGGARTAVWTYRIPHHQEPHAEDAYAATRRAIVRAAAAIGSTP